MDLCSLYCTAVIHVLWTIQDTCLQIPKFNEFHRISYFVALCIYKVLIIRNETLIAHSLRDTLYVWHMKQLIVCKI